MEESGLTEIIPLVCISAIWGPNPIFSYPEFLGPHQRKWLQSDGCFVVAQSPTRVQLSATPWTAARQSSLTFTVSLSLLRLMSVESVVPSKHLILCHSLLLRPLSLLDGRYSSFWVPSGSLAHTGGLQSLMTVTSLSPDMAGNLLHLRAEEHEARLERPGKKR